MNRFICGTVSDDSISAQTETAISVFIFGMGNSPRHSTTTAFHQAWHLQGV